MHMLEFDIGSSIDPNPVSDNVRDVDIVAIVTIVSNDFTNVVNVLYFIFFFRLMIFVFEVSSQFFNVVNRDIKTIQSFNFFFSLCSKSCSKHIKGADGYNLSVFLFYLCSIKDTNLPKYNPLPVL